MKKRGLSLLVPLCLLLALVPGTVFAAAGSVLHCHDMSAECGGAGVEFTAWESGDSFPAASGHYYLTRDMTLKTGGRVNSGVDIDLCLNGHTVNVAKNYNILVSSGGTLNICDCQDEKGTIQGSNSSYGILQLSGGTAALCGGAVWNTVTPSAPYAGPAVRVNGGTFHLSGGAVTAQGCAIYADHAGAVYLSGTPAISGNYADFRMEYSVSKAIGTTLCAHKVDAPAAAYAGGALTVVDLTGNRPDGTVAVNGVTADNKGKFFVSGQTPGYELYETGTDLRMRMIPHKITGQPTPGDPTVEVNASDAVWYQWYKVDRITDLAVVEGIAGEGQVAAASVFFGSCADGTWTAEPDGETYSVWLGYPVQAEDVVAVTPTAGVTFTTYRDNAEFHNFIYNTETGAYISVASAEWGAAYGGGCVFQANDPFEVTIAVTHFDMVPVNGQTTAAFTAAAEGTYLCKVTFDDGTVLLSAPVAFAHTHSPVKVSGQPAACEAAGWKDCYRCSCGRYFADDRGVTEITDLAAWKAGDGKIDALGHDWGGWETAAEPTCAAAGGEIRTCSNDAAHTETRSIDPIGHSWDEAWGYDAAHHWHECRNTGCPVTENSRKSGYAAHVYNDDRDDTCSICGCIRVLGPLPSYSTPAEGEGCAIDFDRETIAVAPGYEVKDGTGAAVNTGDKLIPGATLFIRKAADDGGRASEWAAVAVPARPAGPAAPRAVNETIKGKGDGKVTGLTADMEYSVDDQPGWTPCAAAEYAVTAVPGNGLAFRVRYKATAAAFAGEAVSLRVEPGRSLTVIFDAQGGSALAPITGLAYGAKVSAPAAPTKSGSLFGGWYTGADCVTLWDFANDTAADDLTLYARWVERTGSIFGRVTKDVSAVGGAEVKLMRGSVQYGETAVTSADGAYIFSNVAPGVYNIVTAKEGGTMTALVDSTAGDAVRRDLTVTGGVNSVLEVKGGDTPEVVVGGLDAEARAVKEQEAGAASVTVTMTVEGKAEDAAGHEELRAAAGNDKTLEYLEFRAEKTVDDATAEITAVNGLLEIIIPFDFAGKTDVMVCRCRGGSVDILTTGANGEGENMKLGTASIILHVKNFSTYAISYAEEGASKPPEPAAGSSADVTRTITASAGEGGAITPSGRVSVRQGGSKTFTITPAEGHVVANVLVDGESVGAVSEYTFEKATKVHTITVSFKRADAVTACRKDETCPARLFIDLDLSRWYHDGIHFCVERGLMVGTSESTFAPDMDTSRAMIAAILWRLRGSPVVDHALQYDDVAGDTWYAEAIRWAASEGIVNGYGSLDSGRFGPDDPITREQLAVMLYRYEQKYGGGGFTGSWMFLLDFQDMDQVSEWAYEALCWMTMNQVITGKDGKVLDPKGLASRAEAAAMLRRDIRASEQ